MDHLEKKSKLFPVVLSKLSAVEFKTCYSGGQQEVVKYELRKQGKREACSQEKGQLSCLKGWV